MLARPTSSLCTRVTAGSRSSSVVQLLPSARCASSAAASAPAVSADSVTQDAATLMLTKRSVPRANTFGDLFIRMYFAYLFCNMTHELICTYFFVNS